MIKIKKRRIKNNGHYQLTLKIRSNTWISDMVNKHFRNENFEMLKRYLKVSCKELENYFIANDDIVNLTRVNDNVFQMEVVKYTLKH